MQNVALITLHRSANYGSVLQALATQVVLERMGHDVTVVDYYAPRNSVPEMLRGLKHKKQLFEKNPLALFAARAILLPSYIKRRRNFDRFITHSLNLSKKTYHSSEELALDLPQAELYVTGSDQVWNSEWNGGIDEALFLAFTPEDAPRISFPHPSVKDTSRTVRLYVRANSLNAMVVSLFVRTRGSKSYTIWDSKHSRCLTQRCF